MSEVKTISRQDYIKELRLINDEMKKLKEDALLIRQKISSIGEESRKLNDEFGTRKSTEIEDGDDLIRCIKFIQKASYLNIVYNMGGFDDRKKAIIARKNILQERYNKLISLTVI